MLIKLLSFIVASLPDLQVSVSHFPSVLLDHFLNTLFSKICIGRYFFVKKRAIITCGNYRTFSKEYEEGKQMLS